jgi:membrane-bound lytic murein transglycosylase D
MKDVAEEFSIEEDQLKAYNKWVRKDHIPDDKVYMLFIPTIGATKARTDAIARAEEKNPLDQPTRLDARPADASLITMMLYGIPAVKARAGDSPASLAKRADLDISSFLKFNDISVSDRILPDQFYYLKRKKTKGSVPNHIVKAGDNLWSISQQYGVQLRKLERYNKLTRSSVLREGSVIYLSNKRTVTQEKSVEEAIEVEEGETFNWTVRPEANPAPDTPPAIIIPQDPIIIQPTIVPIDSVKTDTLGVQQHVVAAGETLYSIAKRYKLGVMELVEWNNLSLSEGIKPGQVLRLNNGINNAVVEPTSMEVLHTVKSSDTLYSIAREYGVTIKELMDWNQKKDFSLTVGEKLRIVKKL